MDVHDIIFSLFVCAPPQSIGIKFNECPCQKFSGAVSKISIKLVNSVKTSSRFFRDRDVGRGAVGDTTTLWKCYEVNICISATMGVQVLILCQRLPSKISGRPCVRSHGIW